MPTPPSFEEQIRAYNEELRRYYAQSHAVSRTSQPTPAPEATPEESDRVDTEAVTETESESDANADTNAEAETDREPPIPISDDAGREGDPGEASAPPVERPWEAMHAEEWMNSLPRPQATEDAHRLSGEENAAGAPEPSADERDPADNPIWADPSWSDPPDPAEGVPVDPWASITAYREPDGGTDEADDPDGATWQAPPFGNDPPQPVEPPADSETGADENSDIGFLQVRVFSARGAVPLVGAIVSIIGHNAAGQETLLHMNPTDQSGIAPQVSLPTPDRALSYKPGDATPFLNYIVQVSAPGYVTIRNERVAVYGGVTSLQGVPMIPLPEPQADYQNEVVVRPGGAPPELN